MIPNVALMLFRTGRRVPFPQDDHYGWTFDVEILAIARRMKYRIIEVPIPGTTGQQQGSCAA